MLKQIRPAIPLGSWEQGRKSILWLIRNLIIVLRDWNPRQQKMPSYKSSLGIPI